VIATIRDVASAAGVSASTVSRAFGRPEKVDEITRQRIFRAAEELGYQPNRAAQSLSTGRTGNIGIVVPDIDNPFFSSVVKGAQTQARELGYPVLLADADENPMAELRLAQTLARQVDGLILCSPRTSETKLRETQGSRPVVLVNRNVSGLPAVTIDNADGVRQAVAHLRALRHHRVGYVAGPGMSHSNLERQKAVEQQLTAAGLTYVLVGAFDPSFEGGRGAADEVLLSDVSAVIVYNDLMAIGLISQLTSYGVGIPTELSVVGFDDIPFATMFTPPLTTVHIPREQAGWVAVEYLHALMDNDGTQVDPPRRLATTLVIRGTTARAR
jgi:DNA-binding LacI/PurR family transcriptional regulator